MAFETLLYATHGPVCTITLNRPERLNTIVPPMPDEIEAAVVRANREPDVRVIVLRGAGRSFCAGFDFGDDFAAHPQPRDRLHLPELQPDRRPHVFENVELPLTYRGMRSAERKERVQRGPGEGGMAHRAGTSPASSPAASSSAWPWPAPWWASRSSCWPTSPPGTWTRSNGEAVMELLDEPAPERRHHLHGHPRRALRPPRRAYGSSVRRVGGRGARWRPASLGLMMIQLQNVEKFFENGSRPEPTSCAASTTSR